MSNLRPPHALLVVIAVVVFGTARPASAEGTQARAHYERGRSYFQLGEYRRAIEEFKAAHVEKNDPAYLYNIAECHRQLGEAKDAVTFYQRFVTLSVPAHPLRPEAERRIVELEAPRPARAVEPLPPPPPPAPLARPTPPPASPPVATPPAHRPIVPPPAGGTTPLPAAPAPAPAPEPVASASASRHPNRVPAFILGAAGLVALGVGGYFAFDARSQWQDSEPRCPADSCDPEGDRLSRGAQRSARIADITVGAGLVAAGVAGWLFLRARPASESAPSPAGAAGRVHLVPQLWREGRAGLTLATSW